MNRWMCPPVVRCVQIRAGKDNCGRSSRPPPAGSKAAAEGEVDVAVFVLSPRSKWHYDNCAIVFSAELHCLREETNCHHHHRLAWKRKQVSVFTRDSIPWSPRLSCPFPALMLHWYAPESPKGYTTIQNPGEKLAISVYADDIFSTEINCSSSPTQFSGLWAKQVNSNDAWQGCGKMQGKEEVSQWD